MKTRRVITALLLVMPAIFLLFSCTDTSDNQQDYSPLSRQTETSGQIVDRYVDTLTTAQDKAKKAADAVSRKIEKEQQSVQAMDSP